jgi:RNA polymerase sigma-70 factor (ECF subfamily)
MSSQPAPKITNFHQHLSAARAGSREDLGRLLMDCRNYLLLVANRNLDANLQGKFSPSDLVQETFFEAQRDFARFQGHHEDELLAWLSRVLLNNVANASRRYLATEKRALHREIPLANDAGGLLAEGLCQDTPTPSEQLATKEQAAALAVALDGLPQHYRQVLRLRYQEQMTFAQIGAALGCSAEAARKHWARAVDRLQYQLDCSR